MKKKKEEKVYHFKIMSEKHFKMFLLMNHWVRTKQEGKEVIKFFYENNIESIAIYGMNYIGQTLLNELKESQVKVKYGIDKKPENIYSDIKIYTPSKNLPTVDAVVVTSIFYYNSVEKELRRQMQCKILSIEDIIYN